MNLSEKTPLPNSLPVELHGFCVAVNSESLICPYWYGKQMFWNGSACRFNFSMFELFSIAQRAVTAGQYREMHAYGAVMSSGRTAWSPPFTSTRRSSSSLPDFDTHLHGQFGHEMLFVCRNSLWLCLSHASVPRIVNRPVTDYTLRVTTINIARANVPWHFKVSIWYQAAWSVQTFPHLWLIGYDADLAHNQWVFLN